VVGRVIVGVDGSWGSIEALRWAAKHGGQTDGIIDAVSAWPSEFGYVTHPPIAAPGLAMGTAAAAAAEVDQALAAEATEIAQRSVILAEVVEVPIRIRVVRGPAASVLLQLAGPDDMLVVGASRHRAMVGLVTGSVALHLVARARCPVVVVRGDRKGHGRATNE